MKRYLSAVSVLLVLALILTGCGPAEVLEVQVTQVEALAVPSYPEMAPYPNESEYINDLTGEFDSEGFSQIYDAWREDLQNQKNQPEGYQAGLPEFFSRSIPYFLDAETENPVCSPLNLYMALAMLAESTEGSSRQQILDVLHSGSMEFLQTQAGQVWNAHYCNDNASTSILAISLWLDDGYSFREETVQTLAEQFYASVFRGDLGSNEMNAALGGWLNEQTVGLLEEQVQNVTMDPQTAMTLASTILFRAKWSSEFSEEQNTEAVFHAPSGDREITYLNKTMTYGPYYWGRDFGAVSLSLEDGSRMWLILPDEGLTPEDILSSGLAMDLVLMPHAHEDMESIRVNLSLPKFDIASDLQLEEAIGQLGITEVFDPAAADFTAIVPEGGIWLDQVKHAARVMIDEEGVSAAAYTVMMMAGAARPPEDEVDFVLDRPFLFVISSHDDLPLFAGIVNEP